MKNIELKPIDGCFPKDERMPVSWHAYVEELTGTRYEKISKYYLNKEANDERQSDME